MLSTITVERDPDRGRLVVRLRGEIDVSLRDEAGLALAQVAAAGMPVVMDLAGVRFVGATGLAFVVQCRRLCAETGVPCEVLHLPPAAARVFAALGLDDGVTPRGLSGAEPVR